jgi:hypothetical protein
MFLAFPLDFQTREILQQAVGLFGLVVTLTDNTRFRSRILLRCRVTFVSRMPRSIAISESGTVADGGHSWTVPVFVLDSNPNDVVPGNEDPIPPNGNPHPVVNQKMDEDHQEHFEDVGDLQEVQQANLDQGWQIPSPPHPAQNDGWDEWPQQEGELVGDNELNLVNNLANQVVVNVVENGLTQHPEIPQDSSFVSSEASAFFRAQGVPVTVELPLPPNGEVSKTANLP